MYSIGRYCKSSLQRSVFHSRTQRSLANPLFLQYVEFSKSSSKDKDGGKKIVDESEKKASGKDGSDKKKKAPTGPPAPPKIEIRLVPAMYPKSGYDEKNMKLGRQLSPHLSIYKKQLTSVLSILLRISGFVLAIGIWTIGVSGFCGLNLNNLAEKIEKCDCGKGIFNALKFAIVLPFAYHMVAGTRHLLWYLNVFLSKPEIYITGYVTIALSLILAACLSGVNIQQEGENSPKKLVFSGQTDSKLQNLINDDNVYKMGQMRIEEEQVETEPKNDES